MVLWSVGTVVAYVTLTALQVIWASGHDSDGVADAVVVLGAAQYDGSPSGALRGRLDHAAALYRNGRTSAIVVTGGNQPGDRTTEGMTGFVYLRDAGIPEAALLVENGSTNTWEQLSATKLILDERGFGRALLVSDPYHNLRLLGAARQLDLDAGVSSTHTPVHAGDVVRETAAVSVGRLIGYRRLASIV